MSALMIIQPSLCQEPAGRAHAPPVDALVDQLLDRWDGQGAPGNVLRKAAQVDRAFRYNHSCVRHDRRWVSNLAFVAAALGIVAIVALSMDLAKMLIGAGEFATRVLVLGALLAACGSVARRGGKRLLIETFCLAAFISILIVGPPAYPPLQRWDMAIAVVGTLLIAGKALRLFADQFVDRSEAQLLLRAAGRR